MRLGTKLILTSNANNAYSKGVYNAIALKIKT